MIKTLTYEIVDLFLFSRALQNFFERLMYNRIFKYSTKNNILYDEEFRFCNSHSTKDDIIEFADKLDIFVKLSRAFDIVNHQILY